MKIINLTPHDINVLSDDLSPVKTYKNEGIARVSTEAKLVGNTDNGVNIYETKYGTVTGLPQKEKGTFYIVSMLVKQACVDRKDLYSPSQLQRDSQGKIIGCLGLE